MEYYRTRISPALSQLFARCSSLAEEYSILLLNAVYQRPWLLRCYKQRKWFYRKVTHTTELVRLCSASPTRRKDNTRDASEIPLLSKDSELAGSEVSAIDAEVIYLVDRSILFSSTLQKERRDIEDKEYGSIDEAFKGILSKKQFPNNGDAKSDQAIRLKTCLLYMNASYKLVDELNDRAKTPYNITNPGHEKKLLQLWDLLMPDEQLPERRTNSWQKIGFQGKDPATDFRGMGMLGLDDLHYFAKTYTVVARNVLEASGHATSWYSFAIVGINITAWTINILRTRRLQYFLYKYGASKTLYHEVYCYVFVKFNEFWSSLIPNVTVMDFERVFGDYTKSLEGEIVKRHPLLLDESSVAFENDRKSN